MKKLFVLIAFVAAVLSMASCDFGGTTATEEPTTDTIVVVADSTKADSLVQCKGITKKGTQCERMLWWPDTLCFQHKDHTIGYWE